MIRILFILILLYVAFRLLSKFIVPYRQSSAESGRNLTRCCHCGTLVPENQAVTRDGQDYCGKECAKTVG